MEQQIKTLVTRLQQNPQDPKTAIELGTLFFKSQQYENAAKAFAHALQFQPYSTDLYYKLGMSYLNIEDERAIAAFEKILKLHPKNDPKVRTLTKVKLAKAYKYDEQYDKARKIVEAIIRRQPENASALSVLGQIEQQEEQTERAHKLFLKVAKLMPENAAAHNNVGSTAMILERYEESIQHYKKAIQLKPKWATPLREMARSYDKLGDAKTALSLLQKAIQLAPKEIENFDYLAAFYRAQGNHKAAVEVCKRLVQIDPNNSEAYFNIGSSMTQLGITDACLPYFEKAYEIDPTAQAAYAIGNIHQTSKNLDQADNCFQKTLDADPEYYTATYQLIANRAAHCDWLRRAEDEQLMHETLKTHIDSGNINLPLPTLYFNYFNIPMEWHKAFNEHYAKASEQRGAQLRKQFPIKHKIEQKERLRIDYISPDFRNHPVGRLVADLFQHHDRAQFDIYAYSLSTAKPEDPFHPRIKAGVDVYRELAFTPTVEATRQIVEDGIDILIDLGGHTAHTRPDIIAMQPAPIQAHIIGYPNTMGANYMQYILADKYLVPEHVFEYYTEKVVHLPSAFVGALPQLPDIQLTRADVGLPEEGIVFVGFNRPSKIEPEIFAAWLQILKAVEGSVLWLSDLPEQTCQNLRRFAQTQQVDPNRLYFSEWQPYGKYLKSHQLCDLFLDTWHYSAGSTAVAALGAGLPVLTITDDSNASRMGACIVAAAGLEELICDDLESYVEKAIELAQKPELLEQYKTHLRDNREQLLLFDNAWFARGLEAAFWEMWNAQL
ncbi:MAG: tetratricopeptide repeat protein [Bacteroidota bacterium]